ncbi:MAG: VPLPA-CTERM sorting domain-containing protein [Phycisphaerales bacterium]|nr:MAG: VPLPA-CTERM sorting domain-containing protein [Phycisphaerales bacterium]
MRAGIALVCTIILLPAVRAAATPYYIGYEADTPGVFPEDVGWERHPTGGGANRTVADGIFTLSSDDPAVSDIYRFDGNEQMNPDPGEFFFAEWRMRVLPGSANADVSVYFASDDYGGDVSMGWGENDFWSFADGNHLQLDATVFHTYRLESLDMVDYEFYLDGDLAYQGFFDPPTLNSSFAFWGDGGVGQPGTTIYSSSEWDYFRLGVLPVPAPSAAWLLVGAMGAFVLMRRRQIIVH